MKENLKKNNSNEEDILKEQEKGSQHQQEEICLGSKMMMTTSHFNLTPQDTFHLMAEKNPNLELLLNEFNLQFR